MAKLEEYQGGDGTWVFIEEGGDRLQALVHAADAYGGPGITLFWPGRFDAEQMMTFYRTSEGRVSEDRSYAQQARVATFDRVTGDQRLTFGTALADYGYGSPSAPDFEDSDFVRFEHVAIGRDGSESMVLVLWCVVDANPAMQVEVDAMGLLLQPRHLPGLRHYIATLITRTSADQPSLVNVIQMLRELEEHLNPDASPIAMAA